ncbi:MAG TPA: tetratricopeptide repeat protein [Terracidiphilus sp.]|nr:tetratricopeptide repeat protein [Terracidiphilus sp.]
MKALDQRALERLPVRILLAAAALACGIAPAMAQGTTIDPALLEKANGGDAAAQVAVGEKYAQVAGATQDRDEAADDWKQAFAWYQKAADKGNIAGEIHLAEAYTYARGVARDTAKAADLYRKAAEQGDPGAQGTLAMLYTLGQGVPQSDTDAYFWFDLAASADTPNKDRYIANRQNVGTRITADELDAVKERLKKWKAAHPQKSGQ